MEVSVRGRNVKITERFENYVASKVEKVERLLPRAQSFEVRVSRVSDRSPQNGDRVEITVAGPGPVVRAESTGGDKFTAFDIAYGRVLERVRRLKDRRSDRRGRGRVSLGDAVAHDFEQVDVVPAVFAASAGGDVAAGVDVVDEFDARSESPIVIRAKEFPAERMDVSMAVDQMELVGHDFYLFVDVENGRPSVVYRRKGWNYGVISLVDEG